ncbi:MAG: ABC transporter permease [Jatrophihabitans sp.]
MAGDQDIRDGQTSAASNVRLMASREITTRTQQKSFRIGLAVTLLIIAIVALLPRFLGGHATTYDLAIVGGDAKPVSAAVSQLADQRHQKVRLHEADEGEARQKVHDGKWDAALIGNTQIIARSANSDATQLLQGAYQSVAAAQRLQQAGLNPTKVSAALAVPSLQVDAVKSDSSKRQTIATITIVVLFAQLIGFVSWVAMGVVEEKTSRVIELILSTVRPWQLLTGKLIGIGAVALAQLLAMAVVGLGVATAVGGVELPSGTVGAVAISVGWFVLAFAFFCGLAAALASLVSRQEEVSGVLTPVTGVLMVCYFLGFVAVGSPDSTVAKVLSIVPPVSAISMPARMVNGSVPILQVALAVLLMVIATIGVVAVGAKIYRAAVLHTGGKLGLRTAWKGEAVANLD